MSVRVMSHVWESAPAEASAGDMLVALVLADHADRDGGHAFPSLAMLAKAARLDERQVRRCLRRLESWGLIAVERPATNRLPAMYMFPGVRGDISDTPREDIPAPPTEVLGGHLAQPGGTFATSRGDISDTHIYKELEPSEEPSENRQVPPLVPPAGGNAPKDKRATRLKDDWEPTTEMEDWACVNVPCSMFDCKRETEKFMDHFIGNGKRMVDWERAWKNWMRRSREFAPRKNGRDINAGILQPGRVPDVDPQERERLKRIRDEALAKERERQGTAEERWQRKRQQTGVGR